MNTYMLHMPLIQTVGGAKQRTEKIGLAQATIKLSQHLLSRLAEVQLSTEFIHLMVIGFLMLLALIMMILRMALQVTSVHQQMPQKSSTTHQRVSLGSTQSIWYLYSITATSIQNRQMTKHQTEWTDMQVLWVMQSTSSSQLSNKVEITRPKVFEIY